MDDELLDRYYVEGAPLDELAAQAPEPEFEETKVTILKAYGPYAVRRTTDEDKTGG